MCIVMMKKPVPCLWQIKPNNTVITSIFCRQSSSTFSSFLSTKQGLSLIDNSPILKWENNVYIWVFHSVIVVICLNITTVSALTFLSRKGNFTAVCCSLKYNVTKNEQMKMVLQKIALWPNATNISQLFPWQQQRVYWTLSELSDMHKEMVARQALPTMLPYDLLTIKPVKMDLSIMTSYQ